mmetsp:Transcript_22479/g.58617  ORF Transcript_22479/g.58617 Transcript_22479/m.58617 type:complete len:216 (+) Transcript_22479:1043-1690(+)
MPVRCESRKRSVSLAGTRQPCTSSTARCPAVGPHSASSSMSMASRARSHAAISGPHVGVSGKEKRSQTLCGSGRCRTGEKRRAWPCIRTDSCQARTIWREAYSQRASCCSCASQRQCRWHEAMSSWKGASGAADLSIAAAKSCPNSRRMRCRGEAKTAIDASRHALHTLEHIASERQSRMPNVYTSSSPPSSGQPPPSSRASAQPSSSSALGMAQ